MLCKLVNLQCVVFYGWHVSKDEGSFQLRIEAREQLARLGSDWAMELGWRDMWVFVARKGGNQLYLNFILFTTNEIRPLHQFFIGL